MTTETCRGDGRDERFVLLRPPSQLRRIATELLTAAGVDPDVAFEAEDEAEDVATLRGFVGHGLGISILPYLGAAVGRVGTDRVMLRPIADPRARRHLGIAWTTRHPLLPSADLFRQFVIDWATDPSR